MVSGGGGGGVGGGGRIWLAVMVATYRGTVEGGGTVSGWVVGGE